VTIGVGGGTGGYGSGVGLGASFGLGGGQAGHCIVQGLPRRIRQNSAGAMSAALAFVVRIF
jgi:hypothetical protein